MPRLLVGITVYLDPELLDKINAKIKAKSQSERVRLCITEGYVRLREIENVRFAFSGGKKT